MFLDEMLLDALRVILQLKVQQEHLVKIDFSVLVYHSMALYRFTQILHDIYSYKKGQMPMKKPSLFSELNT